MTISPEKLCLIVGNARSGSTILGAILDAHPNAACANESHASFLLWRDYSGEALVRELLNNAVRQRETGRRSAGYGYAIEQPAKRGTLIVLGDKVWNPSLLLLHGKPGLVDKLEQMIGCPVLFVHAVRNPYDVIATMHRRSGASLHDRGLWYSMHCDAAMALSDRLGSRWLNIAHEALIRAPDQAIARLCAFLGLHADEDFIARCRSRLNSAPVKTREGVDWSQDTIALVEQRVSSCTFLHRYLTDRPTKDTDWP